MTSEPAKGFWLKRIALTSIGEQCRIRWLPNCYEHWFIYRGKDSLVPATLEPERKLNKAADAVTLLGQAGVIGKLGKYRRREIIFGQGSPADTLFYLEQGRLKLAIVSSQGKEAVIAILPEGSFFGEGCLAGQTVHVATATALADCLVVAFKKKQVLSTIRKNPDFAEFFIAYLLQRNARIEEDLVDQLFNSSEKRLARVLLLLAQFGKDEVADVIPVTHETLARMIGTTRPRVSFFMKKFRHLGFIDYEKGLRIHPALLTMVLRD
jgi:CRP/FNR family cyclic AMP-dependent transcriptional regulator